MDADRLAEEYEYLEGVMAEIEGRIAELLFRLGGSASDLIRSRREMYDEGRHLVLTFEDAVELSGLKEAVDRESKIYLDCRREYESLVQLHRSAYFGRFDFRESGAEGECERFYIGRSSLFSGTGGCLVYDWRAPVSSIYYEYGVGPASYRGPEQVFSGEVSLKRQYKITDGRIEYMFDTETAVHDRLLAEILAESAGASLKVIIASIQKEQNDAIRNHYCKYLLIRGLAGSGKTSVGLHRMAYILYKHKETVRPENILILSNNNIFKTYISSVLPELGENNVYIRPLGELYKKHIPEGYEAETYYGQLDALSKSPGRAAEIAFKNSPSFLDFLLGYFEGYAYIFEDVRYGNDIIVAKEAFYANAEKSLGVTISKARALIRDGSADYFRRHMREIKLRLEKEHEGYLLERELNGMFRRLERDFIEGELRKLELNNKLDEIALYKDILRLYAGDKNKSVYLSTLFRLDEGRLAYEDLVIILCIRQLTGKIKPETDILHVLVDEAQDCGIFQLYFLKNQYPKSFFTLLGDANQNVEPEAGISDWSALEKVFGSELKSVRLHKCYRSSGPISALAFRLIGAEGTGAEYYDRKGEKPRYVRTDDIAKTVLLLLDAMKGRKLTIGIITPSIDEAEPLYSELYASCGEEVRLLADPGSRLSGRIAVLPLALAKGLEFDAAICVNLMKGGENPEKCRKTAYLAGSRALHELYFVCEEPFPELFADCRELMLLEET